MKDYAREAEQLHELIQQRVPEARTLLDVACGTGLHIEKLSRHYEVAGLDLDRRMLEVARRRLPHVSLHEGDMATFSLGTQFDVVTCLFSSVGYLLTLDLLRQAMSKMFRHVRPGGVLIVEPWITPDDWDADQLAAVFVDQPGLKIARMSVSSKDQERALFVFHYLVGTRDGVEYFTEHHETRLHSHEEYVGSLEAAGLVVEYEPEGFMGRGLYIGLKPHHDDA